VGQRGERKTGNIRRARGEAAVEVVIFTKHFRN
jgi:hypothetical protein